MLQSATTLPAVTPTQNYQNSPTRRNSRNKFSSQQEYSGSHFGTLSLWHWYREDFFKWKPSFGRSKGGWWWGRLNRQSFCLPEIQHLLYRFKGGSLHLKSPGQEMKSSPQPHLLRSFSFTPFEPKQEFWNNISMFITLTGPSIIYNWIIATACWLPTVNTKASGIQVLALYQSSTNPSKHTRILLG